MWLVGECLKKFKGETSKHALAGSYNTGRYPVQQELFVFTVVESMLEIEFIL